MNFDGSKPDLQVPIPLMSQSGKTWPLATYTVIGMIGKGISIAGGPRGNAAFFS